MRPLAPPPAMRTSVLAWSGMGGGSAGGPDACPDRGEVCTAGDGARDALLLGGDALRVRRDFLGPVLRDDHDAGGIADDVVARPDEDAGDRQRLAGRDRDGVTAGPGDGGRTAEDGVAERAVLVHVAVRAVDHGG